MTILLVIGMIVVLYIIAAERAKSSFYKRGNFWIKRTCGLKRSWVRLFHPRVGRQLMQGFAGLDVGDRARAVLIGTDVERGFIDFARTG